MIKRALVTTGTMIDTVKIVYLVIRWAVMIVFFVIVTITVFIPLIIIARARLAPDSHCPLLVGPSRAPCEGPLPFLHNMSLYLMQGQQGTSLVILCHSS
jgi:hypothetical protein